MFYGLLGIGLAVFIVYGLGITDFVWAAACLTGLTCLIVPVTVFLFGIRFRWVRRVRW